MKEPSELLHQLLMEDDISIDKLTECLRTLRNVCASNSAVQSQLGQRDTLLKDVNLAIERGLNAVDSDQWTLFLRICSQFLGNFVVNNPDNQQKVWKQCSSQLKQFIIEHLYNQEVDWSKIYNSNVPISGRLFLLDMIEGAENELPTSLISQLATHFRKQSDCILRTVADRVNTLEPEEVSQLLRLLASKSPHPPHLQALQQDRNFFINCAFLLKSIHMAGKEENNCFAPVAKLSQAGDQLNQHPAFEFKANLVRLLGNLCYKHKENQDMMRDLEIIPILLDCCNIDARNPFIIQWVVLAVRNLCEANPANQSMIAGLTREGLVQSALLTELGITLHDDGENKINVVPLRSTTDR